MTGDKIGTPFLSNGQWMRSDVFDGRPVTVLIAGRHDLTPVARVLGESRYTRRCVGCRTLRYHSDAFHEQEVGVHG